MNSENMFHIKSVYDKLLEMEINLQDILFNQKKLK